MRKVRKKKCDIVTIQRIKFNSISIKINIIKKNENRGKKRY